MNRPNDPRVAIEAHRRRNNGADRESLAIRKEILLLRCELERMELREATTELRGRLSHFGWLKMLLPRVAGRGRLGGFGALLKDYPFVSSLASLALTHGPKLKALRRFQPWLKLAAVGFAGWQAVKAWQAANAADDEADAAHPGQTHPSATGPASAATHAD